MVGCGSGSEPTDAERPSQEDTQTSAIQLGPVEGTLHGRWTMDAEQASVRIEGEESSSASVRRVSGKLLKGDMVESRFVADSGLADTATGRLVLSGRVQVTAEDEKIVLTADKVTYDEKTSLVTAEGHVIVSSADWTSGPYDRLVATPGLEKVGTPDRFRQ